MKKYAVIEKSVGETPLQAIEKFRFKEKIGRDIPLAYAGRLDPMASGKLLVLIGSECKKQKEYHALDKKYQFDVLFGVKSDTGDILGMPMYKKTESISDKKITSAAKKYRGKVTFKYPVFSSKTVENKPLFLWALENRLDEIEIPTTESTIYSLTYKRSWEIEKNRLLEEITAKINSLPKVTETSKELGADFRRKDILHAWEKILTDTNTQETFHIAIFSCIASRGTYMRTLAEEIGKTLGIKSLAYSIHRKTIGKYQPLICGIGFWKQTL